VITEKYLHIFADTDHGRPQVEQDGALAPPPKILNVVSQALSLPPQFGKRRLPKKVLTYLKK